MPLTPSVTRTNLGPLTTTFTPASGCDVLSINFRSSGGFVAQPGDRCTARGQGTNQVLVYLVAETCFPGKFGSYINTDDGYPSTYPVYSPGSVCPSGYVPACTITRKEGDPAPTTSAFITADNAIWNMLYEGETATGCCPSGFTCAVDEQTKCTMEGKPGQVLSGYSYDSDCATSPATATVASTYDPAILKDGPIARAQRLVLIGGSASTGASSQGPAETGAGGQSSSGSDNPGNGGGGGGGLSIGAKVGIGVAVPIVVMSLAAGLFLLFWMRRKRSQQQPIPAEGPGMPLPPGAKPELEGTQGAAFAGPHGVPHDKPELDNSQQRHEMDPTVMVHRPPELYGSWHHPPELDPTTASIRPSELDGHGVAQPHMTEMAAGAVVTRPP